MEPFDKERPKGQDTYGCETKARLKERPDTNVHGVI